LKRTKVSGQVLTAAKLDAHNTPGQKEEIAPHPLMAGGSAAANCAGYSGKIGCRGQN
jgi:alpha-N-arabinofuranosidase